MKKYNPLWIMDTGRGRTCDYLKMGPTVCSISYMLCKSSCVYFYPGSKVTWRKESNSVLVFCFFVELRGKNAINNSMPPGFHPKKYIFYSPQKAFKITFPWNHQL